MTTIQFATYAVVERADGWFAVRSIPCGGSKEVGPIPDEITAWAVTREMIASDEDAVRRIVEGKRAGQ